MATTAQKKKKRKKIIKRIVLLLIIAALIGAVVYGMMRLLKEDDNTEVVTDVVFTGSIITKIGGSGVTMSKNSESITILTEGIVDEVLVKEGDLVEEGDLLYRISSEATEEKLKAAQKNVDDILDQIDEAEAQRTDLIVKAPYSGIILEANSFSTGDTVFEGTTVCQLVDNNKMKMSSYFSYTYEDVIKVGQDVTVSIPSMMLSVPGKVESIYKVRRISQEGSMLFEVVTVLDNPGILTEGMKGTAVLKTKTGELIAPYEDSTLEYYRKTQLTVKAKGPVEYCNIRNYNTVKAEETLLKLGATEIDTAISSLNVSLKKANDALDAANEELLKLNATAPISGTVISLGVFQGEKASVGTVAISIADLQTMIVNIKIDEKDIAYVKPGMIASVDQWGTGTVGIIESVSLSGQFENGVSYFPGVITIDNYDGALMTGSYINWSVSGSQSEDCLILPIQSVKYVDTPEGPRTVVFIQSEFAPDNTVEVTSSLEEIPEGFYPIPVTTGISDNYNVEIIDGVCEGDTVFTQVRKQSTWQ